MKNWKTSTLGLIALASIWAPPKYQSKVQATAVAIAASGLIPAADSKKEQ